MLQELLPRLQQGLENKSFDGSLKFDCGEDGVIVLADGTASDQDRDTDCTLRLSADNLMQLLAGKLNPMTAVMMGKIKISGNPKVAMSLADLLK
ncbi:SCP-2 sterol transfer family protein [Pelagimonas phthalicica]|uniref:SCP-2 sterol transfer family protein n=1 Tax=Pelagimonas phthalicica TaxID=1037362 RepID=A0A238J8B5_9RHOB|nr:SCP2 sterol-binding domain-containing protein [Pelagimonas phthalicica]TDS95294.1 SCP-2 sterol transfer family protein [Pelagimonas phthalicica]SMX26182.1 SCP-2 sterol transfer family protein [Pelagimonas phthalicica]